MKTLPLSVLFHEGPIARAYLAHLAAAGFRVLRIIQMVPRASAISGLIWPGLRSTFVASRQNRTIHHWPRRLAVTYPGLYSDMTRKIGRNFCLEQAFFEEIRGDEGLEKYCADFSRVELSGLRDPKLIEILKAEETKDILFTGGGIIPPAVFDVPGLRFLHIHPGYLPYVRGADGLLWSMLLRGKPGVSCFFMEPGIDQARLVEARDLDPIVFTIPETESPDSLALYRMIFSYYDPVVRASLLTDLIKRFGCPDDMPVVPQNLQADTTFHFMEARIRNMALAKIFVSASKRFCSTLQEKRA